MIGRWTVLAGSATGGAHARAAAGSQDAHAVRETNGTLLVAVADGASSAACGAVGATLVVGLAVQVFAELLRAGPPRHAHGWTTLITTGGDRLIRRFDQAAAALSRAKADLATTVTVVLAHGAWVAVFAVGDGFVVARDRGGELDLLLAPPDATGREPGRTELLPSPRDGGRRLVANLPGLSGLAIGTDGLESMLIEYDRSRPVRAGAAFGRLFALTGDDDPAALDRLLAGRQVAGLTDDDRTLILAVSSAGESAVPGES
ncbi:protein phosphatase 2C domain-containing protein [Paractinoplanes lichenicola]|uniref:Protein phosphatase 2C domain-containing protein n=1 Tax=Paractinoplanes lichenicola TaxID=2802976 RepID=A0ABS1VUC4_9ACTN|nr:protein phosphatase 2C domain-containing protein [Actinoplanes lichenicola]MBL7258042.1 protein phosphatase 2C domain-containing protein [Actinoplanes lichenicola]